MSCRTVRLTPPGTSSTPRSWTGAWPRRPWPRCSPNWVRPQALLLVRGRVLLVGERFEPDGGVAAVGLGFEHGEVAHEGVGGGAVPVLLAGWADDGVTGPDAQHGAVAGADQAGAL